MSSPQLVYIHKAACCAGNEVDGGAEIGPLLRPGTTAFCCAGFIISDSVWKISCRYCEIFFLSYCYEKNNNNTSEHILKHHLRGAAGASVLVMGFQFAARRPGDLSCVKSRTLFYIRQANSRRAAASSALSSDGENRHFHKNWRSIEKSFHRF